MFKNITAMQIEEGDTTLSVLQNAIGDKPFVHCTAMQTTSMGFAEDTQLVSNTLHFEFIKEVKTVPAGAVREMLRERIADIESQQHIKVSKTKRRELADEVQMELLPRVIPKLTRTKAYVDFNTMRLVVDTSSGAVVEDITSVLRKVMLTYPIVTTDADNVMVPISMVLTRWLTSDANLPAPFNYGESVKLVAADGEIVTVKNYGIASPEVRTYLTLGFKVVAIGLIHDNNTLLVLDESLTIGKLLSTIVQPVAAPELSADDADLMLMVGEHRELLTAIVDSLLLK